MSGEATLRAALRDPATRIGGAMLLVILGVALAAPLLAPHDPSWADPTLRLRPPGTEGHLLGLDHQGRDMLSRLIWGARLSLLAGLVPVLIGALVAIPIGLLAAWAERLGAVVLRLADVLFAFPMALLAILVAALLGPGLVNMTLALVVVLLPYNVRVVWQVARALKQELWVEALIASGARLPTILFVELLPNVLPTAIVYATTVTGSIIITAAGLSFLGLGIQPPAAEWGIMVSEGRSVIFTAPHVAALPGLAITILVVACNLLGDGLRDALDPRTRLAA